MFEPILDYLNQLLGVLENSVAQCIAAAPVYVRQEFQSQVNRKLKSSAEEYMAALKIETLNDGVIEVTLNPDNFLAMAAEEGASAWDMKTTHLKSPKTKISKNGHKYLVIPIQQLKSTVTSGTERGQALQEKIKTLLNDSGTIYKPTTRSPFQVKNSPYVQTMERVMSSDPELQGLMRVRQWNSMEHAQSGKSPRMSQFVLFRVMSDNPNQKDRWKHPGIKARHIFRGVELWSNSVLPELLSKIIENNVNRIS